MKTAILLAVYGAGTSQGRAGVQHFESLCRQRFPDYPLRWAFTSFRLRERIADARQKSDSVRKALMRLHFEKYENVALQPLQAISGREYEEVMESVGDIARDTGMRIAVGKPLLNEHCEVERVATALVSDAPKERASDENIIFLGHGSRHPAMRLYDSLADALEKLDKNILLGTLRGERELEKLMPALLSRRVWLIPLLSLVGGHAMKDMAGEDSDSWKSRINARGHECQSVLKGLAQSPEVSRIWLDCLEVALGEL